MITLKGLFVLPQAFIIHKPRNVSKEERKPRPDNPIRINCTGEWMTESRHYVITLAEDLRRRGEIALAIIISNCAPECLTTDAKQGESIRIDEWCCVDLVVLLSVFSTDLPTIGRIWLRPWVTSNGTRSVILPSKLPEEGVLLIS